LTFINEDKSFTGDGSTFIDDDKSFADEGESAVCGSSTFIDESSTLIDEGKSFAGNGSTFIDKGKSLIDGGLGEVVIVLVIAISFLVKTSCRLGEAKRNPTLSKQVLDSKSFHLNQEILTGYLCQN
jgi:hypothetical protein